MLKAIIIDDVKDFRDAIKRIVTSNGYNIQIVAEADCVKEGELQILKHSPDIVFLDVEMPDGTGFDLLQRLDSINFKVIFVTGYQDFSIKAFKFSAIDYILKPIDKDELHSAIIRTIDTIDKESLTTKFSALFNNVSKKNQQPQKLVLKTSEKIFVIDINDIVRCEADKSYTQFYLADGKKILVSKTMKEYEDLLCEPQFFRAHHSHLININYFDHFLKTEGGTIIMKDKSVVPVSARRKVDLINLMDKL